MNVGGRHNKTEAKTGKKQVSSVRALTDKKFSVERECVSQKDGKMSQTTENT